jgi:cytochrome b involved in lipid metabolism
MNKNIIFAVTFIIVIASAFFIIHQKNSTVAPVNTYQADTAKTDLATSTTPTTPSSHSTASTTPIIPVVPKVKSYTLAEVSVHNSQSSCWTTVQGKVYDLTNFISSHPGGEGNILRICGIDGTAAFEGQHGGQGRPEQILTTMFIGNLK